MDGDTFARAQSESDRLGRPLVETAIALGWLEEATYARLLAAHFKAPMFGRLHAGAACAETRATSDGRSHICVQIGGTAHVLIIAAETTPLSARQFVHRATPVAFTTRANYAAALAQARPYLSDAAVNGLARLAPANSARSRVWRWQAVSIAGLGGVITGAAAIAPWEAARLALLSLSVPFLCIVLMRIAAFCRQVLPAPARRAEPRIPDKDLPVYSVLVPLFREARVLPQLIRALSALDYPAAKLDIILILETVDEETRRAADRHALPGSMRIIVVPDSEPRTKPKAMNYALNFARGTYVAVFDAEDQPEVDQLRRALAQFRRSSSDRVSCVQAALNIYNARDGWLTRQFAIEYCVLFDALLPAYERLGVPLPLGGTSNHFPTDALRRIGGWDPFNVTEDADLGIRMARAGWRTRTVASTTWEEAPSKLRIWFKQRTRWLKGWMQTYLVHMRRPFQLRRDLGWRGFIGFQVVMGGIVLSTLVHPLAYVALAIELSSGSLWRSADDWLSLIAWHLSIGTLVAGYATAILTGVVAVFKRRRWQLLPATLAMPLYWLLISFAAYRALWQLVRDPFRWEKTEHGDATGHPPDTSMLLALQKR